jgi:hypothetical protein
MELIMIESGDKKFGIFWIASYPRSGNTLVRIALSRMLLEPGAQRSLDTNFPEFVAGQTMPVNGTTFPSSKLDVRFVKTHCDQIPKLPTCIGGVYLYRHPLDVLLSSLNYMFINSSSQPEFARYYGNVPQSVEKLAEEGYLQLYLERFVNDLGIAPMRLTSGTWIDNVNGWTDFAEKQAILVLSYETLISAYAVHMRKILERAAVEVSPDRFQKGLASTLLATKPNGGFFWRGTADTRLQFFSSKEISDAEAALFPLLHRRDLFARTKQ